MPRWYQLWQQLFWSVFTLSLDKAQQTVKSCSLAAYCWGLVYSLILVTFNLNIAKIPVCTLLSMKNNPYGRRMYTP